MPKTKVRISQRAFTLLELIVVMAITGILLTIISVPLYQSFQIVRGAQQEANAQDAVRRLDAQIIGELKQAAGVYDNTGSRGMVSVNLPAADGTVSNQLLPGAKLILAKAAQNPTLDGGGNFVDPTTGKTDPTLSGGKGQVLLPATAGDEITMYIVGLKDPFRLYNNPYEQFKRTGGLRWDFAAATRTAWTAQFAGADAARQGSGEDNMYVLYRIDVNPYIRFGGVRIVNTNLFADLGRVDVAGLAGSANPADQAEANRAASGGADILDPYLLDLTRQPAAYTTTIPGWTDPTSFGGNLATSAKGQMIKNLLAHSRVVSDINHLDMVIPQFDKRSFAIQFDTLQPRVSSMATFRPTHVEAEPAEGQLAVRNGEENPNAKKLGPDTYRTKFGSWNDITMSIFPSEYPASFTSGPNVAAPRVPWQPAYGQTMTVQQNARGGYSLFTGGGLTEAFDITKYQNMASLGQPYAFSQSVMAGAAANPKDFIPVVPSPGKGNVGASFDIRSFGNIADGSSYNNNVPSSSTAGPGVFLGPQALITDPTYGTGVLWNAYSTPNERFAVLYNNWDSLWPGGSAPAKDSAAGPKRFIDLRVMPMNGASGTFGPLDPRNGIGRISITPGSENIYGPDQSPGGNPAVLVRYTRVPNVDTVTVGPNQYKINYVDQADPDWTAFGFVGPSYDPLSYNPADFVSSTLQPRFRAGYLELNSQVGAPLPPGNIYATYRFQFTEPADVVTVSYDTAHAIEAVLSVATYGNPTTPTPSVTTVSGTAEVHNLLR